jgi:hypothetical protein
MREGAKRLALWVMREGAKRLALWVTRTALRSPIGVEGRSTLTLGSAFG